MFHTNVKPVAPGHRAEKRLASTLQQHRAAFLSPSDRIAADNYNASSVNGLQTSGILESTDFGMSPAKKARAANRPQAATAKANHDKENLVSMPSPEQGRTTPVTAAANFTVLMEQIHSTYRSYSVAS